MSRTHMPRIPQTHTIRSAFFRPFEQFTQNTKGTFETTGITHSQKAQDVHTTAKFEIYGYQKARSVFKHLIICTFSVRSPFIFGLTIVIVDAIKLLSPVMILF